MRLWTTKFRLAFAGLGKGMTGQSSFLVHIPTSVLVVLAAWFLECELWQWCVLLLCIGWVLSAELMNSAVEQLAKGLCREHNERVGAALDIASAAVLVSAIAAAIIGGIIFANRIAQLAGFV